MPTPREAAQKQNHEKADYCGTCGLPKSECWHSKYVEHDGKTKGSSEEKPEEVEG